VVELDYDVLDLILVIIEPPVRRFQIRKKIDIRGVVFRNQQSKNTKMFDLHCRLAMQFKSGNQGD
jgi:hypothetical protein